MADCHVVSVVTLV